MKGSIKWIIWRISDPFQILSSQLSIVINISYHKIAEWLRLEGTWRSSGSSPLLTQSHLFDHVQMAFDYLQAWRLHNRVGHPVPLHSHPQGKKKKLFPDVQMESPVFHFVPSASGPVTGNRLSLSSWHTPFRHFYALVRSMLPTFSFLW